MSCRVVWPQSATAALWPDFPSRCHVLYTKTRTTRVPNTRPKVTREANEQVCNPTGHLE